MVHLTLNQIIKSLTTCSLASILIITQCKRVRSKVIGSVRCPLSSKKIFKSHDIAPLFTSEHVRNFINNRLLTLSFQLFLVQLFIPFSIWPRVTPTTLYALCSPRTFTGRVMYYQWATDYSKSNNISTTNYCMCSKEPSAAYTHKTVWVVLW